MQFGRARKISSAGLQNTQRKILRNFMKFYLDAGKIAAATYKICSSLDKTARDNRQNFTKFHRVPIGLALALLLHTRRIHRPCKRRHLFGFWYQREHISCFSFLPLRALLRRYMPSLSFIHAKPVCPCLSIKMPPSFAYPRIMRVLLQDIETGYA